MAASFTRTNQTVLPYRIAKGKVSHLSDNRRDLPEDMSGLSCWLKQDKTKTTWQSSQPFRLFLLLRLSRSFSALLNDA